MAALHDPNNKFWAEDTSGFGFRMLEKMGWKAGKGLGANEDGMIKNLPVTKKDDNRGVGSKLCSEEPQAWAATSKDYTQVLQILQNAIDAKKDQKGSDEEKKEKKKDKKDKKDKEKKKKDKKEKSKRKQERELKRKDKELNHAHFIPTRVIVGKKVSSYSKADLNAIFGVVPADTFATPAPPPVHHEQDHDNTDGIFTVNSSTNSKDYFKEKLNKRKRPDDDKQAKKKQKVK